MVGGYSLFQNWAATHQQVVERPMMMVRSTDFWNPADEGDTGAVAIPLAFAAPMYLLRRNHLRSTGHGGFSFLEELPESNPEEEWETYDTTDEEFDELLGQLEAAKNTPVQSALRNAPGPNFWDPRRVYICTKAAAIFLLFKCETLEQCENAIGHYPTRILFEVLVTLIRSVRPKLHPISGRTLRAMSRINLLRKTAPLAPFTPRFPQCLDHLLIPTLPLKPGESDLTNVEHMMAAIRVVNIGILKDMEEIPCEEMHNLASYVIYHIMGLVIEYCSVRYESRTDERDLLGVLGLMQRSLPLRYVVFRLVMRVGPAYFTYPHDWFDCLRRKAERAPINENGTLEERKQALKAAIHRRFWWIGAHCFMSVIISGCQQAYEPGRTWHAAVVHRNGTRCFDECICHVDDPIKLVDADKFVLINDNQCSDDSEEHSDSNQLNDSIQLNHSIQHNRSNQLKNSDRLTDHNNLNGIKQLQGSIQLKRYNQFKHAGHLKHPDRLTDPNNLNGFNQLVDQSMWRRGRRYCSCND